jgi:Tfp pilus assembly protein PilF
MLWRLALAYWRQDQPSRGLPLLDEAIQRRPGDVRLHLMRAGIAKRLGREQEARRDMEESMRLTGAATPEEAARALGAYVRLSSSP